MEHNSGQPYKGRDYSSATDTGWKPVTSVAEVREKLAHGDKDFPHAELEGADISGLNLKGAIFDHANLRGANFRGTTMHSTRFQHADLRYAVNLDNAIYLEDAIFFQTIVTERELLAIRHARRRDPKENEFIVQE